jgi:hypothetical protein
MLPAIDTLEAIENAVIEGELDTARELLADLKPLLIGRSVDELMQCKSKIDQLTIAAEARKAARSADLKSLAQKRSSVSKYREIEQAVQR